MAERRFTRRARLVAAVLFAALAYAPVLRAQQLSSDGAYWYEIEVTIFSSQYPEVPYAEIPVPEKSNLRYLPQLRLLQNPGDSYQVVFPPSEPSLPAATLQQSPLPGALAPDTLTVAPAAPVILEGPLFSPAVPESFKIADYARDPFIALDRRTWRFVDVNSRLQSGGEHTVLWHKVWRQPLRARAQTSALQVQGGNEYGDHYQLEGSLRFSGQNGQANVDINVWLSSFVTAPPTTEEEWQLPEMPVLTPPALREPLPSLETALVTPVPAVVWYPEKIWQLNQTRELGPNALYYLDHPTMGVLVEIRPYELPELELPMTEGQPAANSGFE
jgi:hypothetical protein